MPRKTHTEKSDKRGRAVTSREAARRARSRRSISPSTRLDFKNTTLLKQFVTDQGRILPRKYTGLPAHYQRR